jgi:hypothetical protein
MTKDEYKWAGALIRECGNDFMRWNAAAQWLPELDIERFRALARQQDDYLAQRAEIRAGGASAQRALLICSPAGIYDAWRKGSKYFR